MKFSQKSFENWRYLGMGRKFDDHPGLHQKSKVRNNLLHSVYNCHTFVEMSILEV